MSLTASSVPKGRPDVFDRAPVMLYWEITRACDLACLHCRAEAVPGRDPRELSTAEATGLLAQIVGFGRPLPHLVITGGDPLKRPDLEEIIRRAVRLGIQVSLAPSATPLLTRDALTRLQLAGMTGLSLSLDGSTAERHDSLRGVAGCFDRTLATAQSAADLDLPLQINTLVSAQSLDDLPSIYGLLRGMPSRRWSLFFLIQVGRGRLLSSISPAEAERLCRWLFSLTREAPFVIAATEAPFYRRVALERLQRVPRAKAAFARQSIERAFGIRDGNGIAFVSHTGEVSPSGFLPVVAGNVRETSLVDLYRHAPLFLTLRDVATLRGKCGYCQFKSLCGGSRARAHAHSGDYMDSDPLCTYQPTPDCPPGP